MKEHLILCPLCNNEIPFDQSQCAYCGALLAPGPTRGTPILKGVICLKCGAKNYSYDECIACGHPFTKSCPSCGMEMKLTEQQCPQCNLSIRKFGVTRRRTGKTRTSGKSKTVRRLSEKWTFIAPISVALVVILAAVIFSVLGSDDEGEEEAEPKPGQSNPIDTNGDGEPDRWDVFGENGKVVERRFDENNDEIIERIEYYDEGGVVRWAQVDGDANGTFEQMQVYGAKGQLNTAYVYLSSDRQRPTKVEKYNISGKLIERWTDTNGDYVFDHYFRFDGHGRLLIEGTDTKENGWLDLFLIYRGNKQIFQRCYDTNGDGVWEKIETLNAEGIRLILEEDADGNGLWDKKTVFFLSGTARWIQLDENGDGIYETIKYYTEDGRYARTRIDTNGDGIVDRDQ